MKPTAEEIEKANKQQDLMNFHEPRTLDESYYTGMDHDQLSRRNNEQIVSKIANKFAGCERDAPLLMVPQLWLWMIDNVIISALPSFHFVDNIYNPMSHLENELKLKNISVPQDLTSLQLFGLIISEAINFIGRPRCAGLKEPIFYTFESYIAILYDGVQKYVQDYQMDSVQVEQEKIFINEINDVFEELNMIKVTIDQQDTVWKNSTKTLKKICGLGIRIWFE